MNWEAIGAIGEVGGVIAVVATLVYLAVQLKQNTSALRSASYEHWTIASNGFFYALAAISFHSVEIRTC